MAEEAFVLVSCKSGKVEDVMDKVKEIENVKEAYAITGTHDVIAFVEGLNMTTIKNVVMDELRGVEEVTETSTAMVVSKWKR